MDMEKDQFAILDLQLFAEPDPVEEAVEEEVVEEETVEDPEPAEEDTDAEEEEPEEEALTEEPHKSDSVPLAKYMAEKKKRQEMERTLAQQQSERDRLNLVQELLERGWPEYEAEKQADERIKSQQKLAQLESKQLEYDIRDLAASDPFYADAASFKTELRDIMAEKNVDAEEAYMLFRGKARVREMKMDSEQRRIAKKPEKKVATASPTPAKNPYPLTADDKKALSELQKAQPDSGWTAKKFYETMYD